MAPSAHTLEKAIESMKSYDYSFSTDELLHRAKEFEKYLKGEGDG